MSEQVTEYRLVWKDSRKDFEAAVRKLIAEGWEPLGGVSVSFAMAPSEHGPRPRLDIVQAMVRREAIPPPPGVT